MRLIVGNEKDTKSVILEFRRCVDTFHRFHAFGKHLRKTFGSD